jgi:hypothetical protein
VLVRRLLIALAVLMALTALAASVAPRREDPGEAPAATGTSAAPPPVEATLSADPEASERLIEAEPGQTVRLTIRGQELATVAIGELEVEVVDPESPALFELLADVPGDYPITVLETEQRIGLLRIAG